MIYGKIGKRYEHARTGNYNCPPGCVEARSACEKMIDGEIDGLLLIGPVGTGKTHLLAAIANSVHRDAEPQYEERDGITVAISQPVVTVALSTM